VTHNSRTIVLERDVDRTVFRGRFSSRARLLATQSALAVMAQGLRMGVGLLIIPISLAYLGKERYGLWMLTLSTLAFVGLLDAGVSPTLKNKMAESRARQDEEAFHYYASGGWLLACSVIVLGALLLPFLALVDWPSVYGLTGQVSSTEARRLTLACFEISVVTVALSFVEALFAAQMLLGTVYLYNSVASLAGAAAVLAAVHLRAGLVTLAITPSLSIVAARIALLFSAYRRGMIRLSMPFSHVGPLLRDVLPNSVSFIGIQVTHVVIGAVPNLITSRFSGLSSVTILAIGQRLATLPLLFVAAVVPVLWPAFTIAWAKGDVSWIRTQYARLVAATVAILTLYACGVLLAGPTVLRVWLRGSVSVPRPILAVLGVWMVLGGVGYWVSTLLHSITDLHIQVVCYAAQAVVAAVLGVLLGSAYGLVGIAIGMTLALVLANLAPLGWRVYSKLNQRARAESLRCAAS
jgi:O-antigen/teichoic acid export membrane protein